MLKDHWDRAFKAFMKLKNDLGGSFNQDIVTSLSLAFFDTQPSVENLMDISEYAKIIFNVIGTDTI